MFDLLKIFDISMIRKIMNTVGKINMRAMKKIFGSSVEIVKERVINYESPKVLYKVYNLKLNNAPMTITGDLVETFIGNNNLKAREDLKKGVKTVISKDTNGTELYKIEVL